VTWAHAREAPSRREADRLGVGGAAIKRGRQGTRGASAGVPVDESVAANFRAKCPDLPMPTTMTREPFSRPSIRATA
jgi:hypothetical protein